jgi:hypothetical protein
MRVVQISIAAVEEENQRSSLMILPVTLQNGREIPTYGMLDTGASGKAFIDESWAQDQRIEILPLRNPVRLEAFDGHNAKRGMVTHYARMGMKIQDHYEKNVVFLVTQLAHYPIILGLPWMKQHDP